MRILTLVALALLIAGCGPSCAERGGSLTFSHFIHVWNGKSTTLTPVYVCRFKEISHD